MSAHGGGAFLRAASDHESARLARIACVIAAGARIANPDDPLGREARATLPRTTGLSPQGVELALTEHLERAPSAEHLAALFAHTGRAPRCHVVLSANVCTAALRAIALAVTTAPRVALRPSRRDPLLATLLVRALEADPRFEASMGSIELCETLRPLPGDEVHAYGADATLAEIAASLPQGVVFRGHGSGFGVALIGEDAPLEDAASALAADIVPFDQRGCLSPRIALVEGSEARVSAFGSALDEALCALGERVPRGPLTSEQAAEIALYRAALEAVGQVLQGPHHTVGLDRHPRALLLPPAARVIHVAATRGDGAALLAPYARYLTTVGISGGEALGRAIQALAPWARWAPLGGMQKPPLDGPVDQRLPVSSRG